MPQITRRQFVTAIGAGLVSASSRTLEGADHRRVIVVGAGLAGLAAAYELSAAGAEVLLIEQSQRVGGRVRTIRGHFADGAWVDVGGQTTGAMYANFFYYATRFGLSFAPQETPAQRPDVLLHLHGKLLSAAHLRRNPEAWPVALAEAEKPLAPLGLLAYYLDPIAAQIGDVANVLAPAFIDYDQLNLRQLLQQRGASPAAIAQIDHTLNYNSVDTVSALSALRDRARALLMRGGQTLNLENGNQDLPDAFAAHLGKTLRFGTRLLRISQSGERVQLHVETDGQAESLYADRVVIAIPFTALRNVGFEPGLPATRQEIIDELPYTQIVQTYLQTRTRFWEDDQPVAMVVSDGPLERLFNASAKMKNGRGLLVNWVNGTGTQNVRAHDAEEQTENVLRKLDAIWPGCRSEIEITFANNWGNSYVRGAYAHYAPGQMAAHAASIHEPIGRIHFAGEHTELVAPGMEGALTSGKRVAAEILAAEGYNEST